MEAWMEAWDENFETKLTCEGRWNKRISKRILGKKKIWKEELCYFQKKVIGNKKVVKDKCVCIYGFRNMLNFGNNKKTMINFSRISIACK